MGYRSEVGMVIVCNNNNYPAFKLEIELLGEKIAEFLNSFEVIQLETTTILRYREESIKWYEDLQDPVLNYVKGLEDRDPNLYNNIHIGFVRVGEDYGDIQTQSINNGSDYISPSTAIIFDI